MDSSSVDIDSFTTLPRRRRDRAPTAEELQEMSLERRLATLNISQSRVPVPPPRIKRIQKRMISLPDKMSTSPTKSQEIYGDKSYSFDEDTSRRLALGRDNDDHLRYSNFSRPTKQSYNKYEVPRKDNWKDSEKYVRSQDIQPMCDIIQSSQQTHRPPQMGQPDILRGSFNADLQSKRIESSKSEKSSDAYQYSMSSHEKGRYLQRRKALDDNKNHIYKGSKSSNDILVNGRHESYTASMDSKPNKYDKTPDHKAPKATSTQTKTSAGLNNRFMFYRPKIEKLHKQHHSAIGLVGIAAEVNYAAGSLQSSPEGSFVNPAFDILDKGDRGTPSKSIAPSPVRPVPTPSRPIYSTMGSSFSTRPCTPSPPSQRFRNQKPPLPSSEPKISPITPGPLPMKPMLSAKQLETSLKQYPSQSRLDPMDMCSPQALEGMMKYYNMPSSNNDSLTDSPPPSKLSASEKNQSPYSSSGSLNVSGDSIDVVLRRKKKVKIRPLSFTSDDESIKRVSLEINLAPSSQNGSDNTNSETTESIEADTNRNEFPISKLLSMSQTSLNQPVEKLDLDDMTSTETAKLLRKQFAKLKVKASTLKVKDTELKQRFANLQNQRGRVCGHGGSVSKSKIRSSPILL